MENNHNTQMDVQDAEQQLVQEELLLGSLIVTLLCIAGNKLFSYASYLCRMVL